MSTYPGVNYFELGRLLDRSSWDNYPVWTGDDRDAGVTEHAAFCHDLMRCVCGDKPFMVMESSPSAVNWQPVNRLRGPGLLLLQSLQAVGHGSDTVQYFQFRKGRGSAEKFHGAVVSHDNSPENRVYKEVCKVGEALRQITPVLGAGAENQIAVIYDWENGWILEDANFGLNTGKGYDATVEAHHAALYRQGFGADVIDQTCDIQKYRLVIGPMTYMLRPGFAERVQAFVRAGGVYVATYCSGWTNEEDLCFMNGRTRLCARFSACGTRKRTRWTKPSAIISPGGASAMKPGIFPPWCMPRGRRFWPNTRKISIAAIPR